LNANAERDLRKIKKYWPLVLILIIAIIVSFIIIYIKVSSPPLFVYYFGVTNTLGNSSSISFSPQISTSGNNMYVAWSNSGPGNGAINVEKISGNNGKATTVINLPNNSSNSTYPHVAASGDNLYVVYADNNGTQGGKGDIFFSSSRDQGKNFDEPINLSNNGGNSTDPRLAAFGNNVYVAWADSGKGGNADIFFSSSRDQGRNFDEPINLSNNNPNSTNPEVAASGHNVGVVYVEDASKRETPDNVRFIIKTSTDNGTHFTTKKFEKKGIDKNTHLPQIAASGDNVYFDLADKDAKEGQPDNIRFIIKTSTDNGTEFINSKGIKNDIDKSTPLPQIAASGDNLYAVWVDNEKGGKGDIFFSSSRDEGKTFNEPINLSNNGANFTNPEVSASGSNAYVLWSDSSSEKNVIKYKHIKIVTLDS
jgi:hypothetical protein